MGYFGICPVLILGLIPTPRYTHVLSQKFAQNTGFSETKTEE